MKRLLLLLSLPADLFSEPLTLTVDFTGIEITNGPLGVLLFDQADGFPDGETNSIRNIFISGTTVQFENLKPGTYAVSVFQDLNGNRKCDTNWIGIPTEPYGFSNYSNKLFLTPRFKKAQFELTPANTRITVPLLD